MTIVKYPRTRHLEGSRLQIGDDANDKPVSELAGEDLVVEEKLDGSNTAVSFGPDDALRLQSRGHFLTGGGRERHFDLFKTWASVHQAGLFAALGRRYIMYGEWLYAKHTVFYDRLPHYFMEFDVFDRNTETFLCTRERQNLLKGLPIMPVPVLYQGNIRSVADINRLVGKSLYKTSDWREALASAAEDSGSRVDMVDRQTDDSDLAEGLYVKLERNGVVEQRFKFVRDDFVQTLQDSGGHWLDRPVLPNQLGAGVDIFAPTLGVQGAYDDPAL